MANYTFSADLGHKEITHTFDADTHAAALVKGVAEWHDLCGLERDYAMRVGHGADVTGEDGWEFDIYGTVVKGCAYFDGNTWYAVRYNDEWSWDYGSHYLLDAVAMAAETEYKQIAVVVGDFCTYEIDVSTLL